MHITAPQNQFRVHTRSQTHFLPYTKHAQSRRDDLYSEIDDRATPDCGIKIRLLLLRHVIQNASSSVIFIHILLISRARGGQQDDDDAQRASARETRDQVPRAARTHTPHAVRDPCAITVHRVHVDGTVYMQLLVLSSARRFGLHEALVLVLAWRGATHEANDDDDRKCAVCVVAAARGCAGHCRWLCGNDVISSFATTHLTDRSKTHKRSHLSTQKILCVKLCVCFFFKWQTIAMIAANYTNPHCFTYYSQLIQSFAPFPAHKYTLKCAQIHIDRRRSLYTSPQTRSVPTIPRDSTAHFNHRRFTLNTIEEYPNGDSSSYKYSQRVQRRCVCVCVKVNMC